MGNIYADMFIMFLAVFLFLDFIVILAIIISYKKEKKIYGWICILVPLMLLTMFALYGAFSYPFRAEYPY